MFSSELVGIKARQKVNGHRSWLNPDPFFAEVLRTDHHFHPRNRLDAWFILACQFLVGGILSRKEVGQDVRAEDGAHASPPLVAQRTLVLDPVNPPIPPHSKEGALFGGVTGLQIVGNRPPHSFGTRDSLLLTKFGEAGNLLFGEVHGRPHGQNDTNG